MQPPGPSRTDAPLLYAALAFATGVVAANYSWRGPLFWSAAVIVFCSAAGYYSSSRTHLAVAPALAAFVAAGGMAFTVREFHNPGPDLSALEEREVILVAHVAREPPEHRRGSQESAQVVDLETDSISVGPPPRLRKPFQKEILGPFGPEQPLRIKVRASIYARDDDEDSEEPIFRQLAYGERVQVIGRLHKPRNFGNPDAFDYRRYLEERGIRAQISVRADRLDRLPGFSGTRLGLWRSRIRNSLLNRIHALWPEADAGLLSAMLVSERSQVSREARMDFQRSGTYHLLVVAGLHLGILAWFCYAVLGRLRLGEIVSSAGTIAFACGYAWLADDGVPIWRATLMLSLYLVARLLYRQHAALNAIGGAALLLLALDPRAIFSASFQLSFAAVLAIVAIAGPFLERTAEPYLSGLREFESTAFDVHLPPRIAQFRLDLRMIAGRLSALVGSRIARFIVVRGTGTVLRLFELIIVSVVMQLALALPMAWYFHRVTAFAVAANVFAVPLAGVLLPAAVVSLGLSYVLPPLAPVPAAIASAALHTISHSVSILGRAGDFRVAAPAATIVIVCLAAFVLAGIGIRARRSVAFAALAAFVLAATLPAVAPQRVSGRSGVLELTAIDVGQGDALFVISPDGHTLLVDSGGQLGSAHAEFDYGDDVIAPYLWSRGIRSLDAIALTHAHSDHIGGMRSILNDFGPHELWLGVNPDTYPMRRLLAQAHSQKVTIHALSAGDTFHFGGAEIRILAPLPHQPVGVRPSNNDSLVMEIAYGNTTALLTGDIDGNVERRLVRSSAATLPDSVQLPATAITVEPQLAIHADVLKVAHHGSANSTSAAFLAAVHPQFAVISDGFLNNFGHPKPEVLRRLEQYHVATYRTDMLGAISFYLDGKSVTVSTRANR